MRIDLERPVGSHRLPVDTTLEDGADQAVPSLEGATVERDEAAPAPEVDERCHFDEYRHELTQCNRPHDW